MQSQSRWVALAVAIAVGSGLAVSGAPEALAGLAATGTQAAPKIQPAPATAKVPAEKNGLVKTPLMGWSTWNSVAYSPSTAKDEAEAKALVSTGLKADGYDYVNQDDFYYGCPGTQGPDVDAYGRWATDPAKFPPSGSTPGIQVVANYVHSLGLKFGMYVTPGISDQAVAQNTPIEGTSYTADEIADGQTEPNFNCGGMQGIDYSKPGAQAFVNSWADELASWGIDYLKIDGVGPSDVADVQAWAKALKQTGRPIALELSNQLSISDAAIWQSLSNGWRTGNDIQCYCATYTTYTYLFTRFDQAADWQPYAKSGAWNDMDSVEVGSSSSTGLTVPEQQTMMSLWSLAASPLSVGTDLTSLGSADLALLENKRVIAVDQDDIPADRVIDSGSEQVFDKRQQNGTWDIGVFNTDTAARHTFRVPLAQLGLRGPARITDLWSGRSAVNSSGTFTATVQPGGVALIAASPTAQRNGTGELVSAQSRRCLQTEGSAFFPGTWQNIEPCHGLLSQAFSFTSAHEVRAMGATECLDITGAVTTPGAKVQLWPCNGGANQQWTLGRNGTITGRQSGLCLNVIGAKTTAGTKVDVARCTGKSNQKWTLTY